MVGPVTAWAFDGVELPFGSAPHQWWISESGSVHDRPVPDAEALPGRYLLAGLVDAHAHPAVGHGPSGPVALDKAAARDTLRAWARSGITLVRDAGSPRGITLELEREAGLPVLHAAGRFLAPPGRYFPELLGDPVPGPDLVRCGLAELGRGATWVKVIADFPDLAAGTATEPTYPIELMAELTAAVHQAGARIAVHSTTARAAELVAIGVDSIEHGTELDAAAIREMAVRGTAWTPTLCGVLSAIDNPGLPPEAHRYLEEARERLSALLPLAVSLGVPVLAGTDAEGSISQEVALLARLGLRPDEALAAASTWPRQYLDAAATSDIVTYHHDPRADPDELTRPAAVIAGGIRLI
jgi:imidazolonepropionase-like amidohydrolase